MQFISSTPDGVAWRLFETDLLVIFNREDCTVQFNEERPVALKESPAFVRKTIVNWYRGGNHVATGNRQKGPIPGPRLVTGSGVNGGIPGW